MSADKARKAMATVLGMLAMLAVGPVGAVSYFTNGVGGNDWNTAGNWTNPVAVPTSHTFASNSVPANAFANYGATGPTVNGFLVIGGDNLYGHANVPGPFTLNISGGTLTQQNANLHLGSGWDGTVNITGGMLQHLGGGNTYVGDYGPATGRLDVSGSGTFNTSTRLYVGNRNNGGAPSGANGIVAISGNGAVNVATLWVGGTNAASASFSLADNGSFSSGGHETVIGFKTPATGTQSGGTFNVNGGNGAFFIGSDHGPGVSSYTQTGGTVTINPATTSWGLRLTNNQPAATAIYNLEGGLLTTPKMSKGSGTALFNFGGGTLQANANLSVPADLPVVLTGIGGDATVDSGGFGVELQTPLSGPGGLVKTGAGTLTMRVPNAYLGNTTVSGGTLRLADAQIAPGAALWLDATDSSTLFQDAAGTIPVTGAGQPVGLWQDKSGNLNHAAQGAAASQPTFSTSGIGPHPGVTFDGSNDRIVSAFNPNYTVAPSLTLAMVYRKISDTVNDALYGQDNGGWDRFQLLNFPASPGIANGISTGGGTAYTPGVVTTNPIIYTAVLQNGVGNGSTVYINGAPDRIFTENHGNTGQNVFTLGDIGSGGGYPSNVQIAEVVAYTSALSFNDRAALEAYLGSKWGAGYLPDAGAVTVAGGGTLDIGNNVETVGPVTLQDGTIAGSTGTLIGSTYDVRKGTVSAVLGGSAAMTKSTSDTVTLSAGNTFTGDTTVNAGTLDLTGGGSLYSGGTYAGTINVESAGTLRFSRHDTFGNAPSNPAVTINVNGGTVTNTATWFTPLGNVVLDEGTIAANQGHAQWDSFLFKGTVSSVAAANPSYLTSSGANSSFHLNQVSAGGTTFDVADGTATQDLIVSGTLENYYPTGGAANFGGLVKTGAGTMVLSGVNTYNGGTRVTDGTLNIAAGGVLNGTNLVNAVSGGVLTIDGTVTVGDNGAFAVGNGTAGHGTTNIETGAVVNIGNGSGGFAGRTYIGGKLDGGGSFGTGTLNINGGTLNVAAGGPASVGDGYNFWLNAWGSAGTSTLNLNGGVLSTARSIADGGQDQSVFNFNGGTLLLQANNVSLLNNLTVNVRDGGAIIDTNTYSTSIGRPLLHSTIGGDNAIDGGLTKNGTGTLRLTANNTFTGNTTVNAGTLAIAGGGSLYSGGTYAGQITVNNGGTLSFDKNDTFGNHLANPLATITVNAGGVVTNGGNWFTTLGPLELNGGSLQAIGGANPNYQAYSLKNTVTVNGSVQSTIATGGSYPGVHLWGNIPFDVADGAAPVDLMVAAPLINRAGGGTGGLVKSGAGTMTLSAANSYTGPTNVNAGTLLVDGSVPGNVTVAPGATLGGGGSVGGTVFVGGTLSPGSSPGHITNGATEWPGGGSYLWELNSADGTAGSDPGWDLLSVTNALDITANSASPFSIDIDGLVSPGNTPGWPDGIFDLKGKWWTFMIAEAGIVNGFSPDSFLLDPSGFAPIGDWSISATETGVFLTFTSTVPEPSTGLLLLAGLAAAAIARRRR